MSTTQHNKFLIRRFIEEIGNTEDVTHLDRFVSPECVATDGKVRVRCGVAGMAEHVKAVRETYPDLHLTVGNQIAEGEWVATQVTPGLVARNGADRQGCGDYRRQCGPRRRRPDRRAWRRRQHVRGASRNRCHPAGDIRGAGLIWSSR